MVQHTGSSETRTTDPSDGQEREVRSCRLLLRIVGAATCIGAGRAGALAVSLSAGSQPFV